MTPDGSVMPVIPMTPVLRPEALRSLLLSAPAKDEPAAPVKNAIESRERLGVLFDGYGQKSRG